jgi:acyl-CoA synthetase (AMP-forming)/AMP-acid ligase II
MAKVMGRTDDMLIIRGVNVFPSQIEELIVGQSYLAPHYILEVRRDGALDHLEVVVELDPQVANVATVRDEAARDLQHRIKSYVGVTASVSVCNPAVIERSVGRRSACSTGAVKVSRPLPALDGRSVRQCPAVLPRSLMVPACTRTRRLSFLIALFATATLAHAQEPKQLAITFDDLPFGYARNLTIA